MGIVRCTTVGRARRWFRSVGLVGLVTILLSGCWSQIGYGPGHTWSNPVEDDLTAANVATLEQRWSVDVGSEYVPAEAVAAEGNIYITSQTSSSLHVRALAPADGSTAWERNIVVPGEVDVLTTPGAIVGDELWTGYFAVVYEGGVPASCDWQNIHLDATDGSILREEDSVFATAAVQAGSFVAQVYSSYCGGDDAPFVVVRDAETRAEVWRYVFPSGATLDTSILPTVVGDRTIVARGPNLYGFATGGCGQGVCPPLWSHNLGSNVSTPVAGPDGQVLVSTTGGNLVSLTADDGAITWQQPITSPVVSTIAGMAVAGPNLYLTTGNFQGSQLLVFDAAGCDAPPCSPKWTAAGGGGRPVVAGGVVYQADGTTVRAFDAAGCGTAVCDPLGTVSAPGLVEHLSVDGGQLFVVSGDGAVTAYGPS